MQRQCITVWNVYHRRRDARPWPCIFSSCWHITAHLCIVRSTDPIYFRSTVSSIHHCQAGLICTSYILSSTAYRQHLFWKRYALPAFLTTVAARRAASAFVRFKMSKYLITLRSTDAFRKPKMHQNSFSARVPPRTQLGELRTLPSRLTSHPSTPSTSRLTVPQRLFLQIKHWSRSLDAYWTSLALIIAQASIACFWFYRILSVAV